MEAVVVAAWGTNPQRARCALERVGAAGAVCVACVTGADELLRSALGLVGAVGERDRDAEYDALLDAALRALARLLSTCARAHHVRALLELVGRTTLSTQRLAPDLLCALGTACVADAREACAPLASVLLATPSAHMRVKLKHRTPLVGSDALQFSCWALLRLDELAPLDAHGADQPPAADAKGTAESAWPIWSWDGDAAGVRAGLELGVCASDGSLELAHSWARAARSPRGDASAADSSADGNADGGRTVARHRVCARGASAADRVADPLRIPRGTWRLLVIEVGPARDAERPAGAEAASEPPPPAWFKLDLRFDWIRRPAAAAREQRGERRSVVTVSLDDLPAATVELGRALPCASADGMRAVCALGSRAPPREGAAAMPAVRVASVLICEGGVPSGARECVWRALAGGGRSLVQAAAMAGMHARHAHDAASAVGPVAPREGGADAGAALDGATGAGVARSPASRLDSPIAPTQLPSPAIVAADPSSAPRQSFLPCLLYTSPSPRD